jgi:catechol 2,3-dioxygenase-like lactoylglutathione lyase family enzyme
MLKFDHLRLPVSDLARSREWYVRTLGLTVEFEMPERKTVARQDGDCFAIFGRAERTRSREHACVLR